MNNTTLLKLHRWVSLTFSLPLLLIIVTGMILSVEPIIQGRGLPAGMVDADRLAGLVQRYDPDNKARGLRISPTSAQIRLLGPALPAIDLTTGEVTTAADPIGDLMLWARRTHEHLFGQDWLVTGSTIAMTIIMCIGVLMGLPRLRNNLSGWHKGAAWFTLPLLLLSPLSGLCLAFGLTFAGGPPPPASGMTLTAAVRQLGASHDVSHLSMLANRGGRLMARIYEDGELRAYTVTKDSVAPMARNWPRLLHEGNWLDWLSGSLNLITSVVLFGLLGTGVVLWARRKLRRRPQRPAPPEAAPAV
ncbi:PepSY-associated TM helix domain-containing protein [Rhodopseudomonas sp. B29]|uniref:PepSY-associated TM helix domain-containing protein n=1 Tax=Rhodopseudomonas sp. B29 TaxID=95607 RepID=UPI0003450EEA|nr:PepSY-associated TM helix domain-containing protein [Rhodopseudomonas sp. B29]